MTETAAPNLVRRPKRHAANLVKRNASEGYVGKHRAPEDN